MSFGLFSGTSSHQCQVVLNFDSQELETVDMLYLSSVAVDQAVPILNEQLLSFAAVEQ